MKRDLAEAAVIDFISRELLSDEAIRVAKDAYQLAIKEQLAQRDPGEERGMIALSAQEQRLET